jgi:hypothetical protein
MTANMVANRKRLTALPSRVLALLALSVFINYVDRGGSQLRPLC